MTSFIDSDWMSSHRYFPSMFRKLVRDYFVVSFPRRIEKQKNWQKTNNILLVCILYHLSFFRSFISSVFYCIAHITHILPLFIFLFILSSEQIANKWVAHTQIQQHHQGQPLPHLPQDQGNISLLQPAVLHQLEQQIQHITISIIATMGKWMVSIRLLASVP